MVNTENYLYRRKSTINEPDFGLRDPINNRSYKNFLSSSYSLLNIDP
jgi:hypothetical protein